jgi:hypothetical protein
MLGAMKERDHCRHPPHCAACREDTAPSFGWTAPRRRHGVTSGGDFVWSCSSTRRGRGSVGCRNGIMVDIARAEYNYFNPGERAQTP